MSYLFYTLLTWILLPFGLLRLLWRSRKAPAYRARWRERLAWYGASEPEPLRESVVFHAVSVGEVHAAKPLIDTFMQAHPDRRVIVTTSTPTGSGRVRELFGESVVHVYLPWDLRGATRRFLLRFKPTLLVLLETELWPNLLRACREQRCRVVLANARLSAKSARGYARFPALTRATLRNLALVAAQAQSDAERFMALGLDPDRVRVNGSLKFDVHLDPEKLRRGRELKQALGGRPVLIAASTREGEDAKVLDAFRRMLAVHGELLLVLVPRHPERFRQARELAQGQGLRAQSFSTGGAVLADTQVLVGDTMGDMQLYYSLADIAFVGGSLVPTGCQNIIEPASLGLPVLTGPSLYNFQKVSELLVAAGGMRVVENAQALAQLVLQLLDDAAERRAMGEFGRAEVLRNQGAAKRLNSMLAELL